MNIRTLNINELSSFSGPCNVYGIVANINPPKKTKGTDYSQTLILKDPTSQEGITINLFHPNPTPDFSIPQFSIAKCSNIFVKRFNGKSQGSGSLGNYSSKLESLLLVVEPGADPSYPKKSSPRVTVNDADIETLRQLQRWWTELNQPPAPQSISSALASPNSSLFNSSIQLNERFYRPLSNLDLTYVDVLLKLVAMERIDRGHWTEILAFGWDGTGNYRHPQCISSSIPLCGSIIKIFIAEQSDLFTDALNTWMYLRNVRVSKGQDMIFIQRSTKIVVLQESVPQVAALLDQYNMRLQVAPVPQPPPPNTTTSTSLLAPTPSNVLYPPPAQEPPQLPPPSRVSVAPSALEPLVPLLHAPPPASGPPLPIDASTTLHPNQPITSIASILSNSTVPNKYRCKAKVLSYFPQSLTQFAIPFSLCPYCNFAMPIDSDSSDDFYCKQCTKFSYGPDQKYLYMFSLRIVDRTGEMDVILFGDDANKFLPGLPAANFQEANCSLEMLAQKINSLTSINNNITLDCCIKSYKSPEGITCYRVFDTTLKI